jgi:cytochrome c peroxidase
MKNKVLYGLGLVIVIYVIFNLFEDHSSNLENSGNEIQQKFLAVIKDNDCLNCHSATSDKPFYSSIPPVATDIENGIKALDLDETILKLEKGEPVSEAVLARIEFSILRQSMPLVQYRLMHWGSSLNDEEQGIILEWIKHTRKNDYGNNLAAESMQNEPVRPISNFFETDSAKVALGKDLFLDMRLSANNTLNCASCHDLNKGGVDRLPVSIGIDDQKGPINAPTVYNAAYNVAQFWDGRAADLQEQAAGPPLNPIEMGCKSFDEIIAKLQSDTLLKARFDSIYEEGITQNSITDAIAEFEKTLITPNSPFDKYLQGDENAITENQKKGYAAFKRVGCASCHVGESMGGQSFEYVGLFADYYADRGKGETPPDLGRFNFTGDESHKYKQKVPNLRNIDLTAPYLHDASSETLMDAVIMMNKYQIESKLSKEEIELVVDFLKSLTGEYNNSKLQ